jgi:predicted N-acetyltransferase YhbS
MIRTAEDTMAPTKRGYRHPQDYDAVCEFLIRTHGGTVGHRNWVQPRWEYMHAHPMTAELKPHFGRFGLWEEAGEIVGLVHCEDRLGIVYVQLDPRHPELKRAMLEHAEAHLTGDLRAGRGVYVYIDDDDDEFGGIARKLGFEPKTEHSGMLSRYEIPDPFPDVEIPVGFRLQSLADEFSVEKVHRVMHRGFDHDGEPPANELEDRRIKLSSPSFRRDLTMVAVGPDGNYVSFCGIWPVPESDVCYIEPVATDPDFRRLGLGTAVVREAIRRCSLEGATAAIVGSDQAFYRSMGFEVYVTQTPWWKPVDV